MTKDDSQSFQEESVYLKEAVKYLESQRKLGIKYLRICDKYHKGYSDIFVCARGQFVILELKDDEGVESPHQKQFINEMRAAGAIGGFCRTMSDIKNYLKEALDG